MRFLIVLFGLIVVANSFKFEEARDKLRALTKFLSPRHDASPGGVHRRQVSPQCLEAYQEFEGNRFQQCYAVLEKVEEQDITTSDLTTYCGHDCTSYMIEVANKIARYCQSGGDSPADEQTLAVLRLMCVKNIHDDYCMVLFSSVLNDKNADFDDCDPIATPCTNVCKKLASYIDTKLDCCFESLVESGVFSDEDAEALGPGFFAKCGEEYIPPYFN